MLSWLQRFVATMKTNTKPCDTLRIPTNDGLHNELTAHNIAKSIGLDWLANLSRI